MNDLELAGSADFPDGTGDDFAATLGRMVELLGPVQDGLAQLGAHVNQVGLAYVRILGEFTEDMGWSWSPDAARWRPDALEIEA